MSTIEIKWPVPNNIKAYFTSRRHGTSHPPYDQFNLAAHVGDDLQAVEKNRRILRETLQLPAEPLWLEQTHSNQVICADQARPSPKADASFATQPNVVCAVLTADCLPILIADKKSRAVAAIHAGWRGLLDGVIDNTLKAINLPGADLIAWLGPALSPSAFEVGNEVRESFITKDTTASKCFVNKGEGKWATDIFELAKLRLKRYDVMQIVGGTFCTYNQTDLFFSYRRDHGTTGRMASLIWLTP